VISRLTAGVLAGVILLSGCTGTSASRRGAEQADVELLRSTAANVTDLMARSDWAAVRTGFDARLLTTLSEERLASGWAQATTAKGEFIARAEPVEVDKPGDSIVFDTAMQFDRGDMKSRISFGPGGKIAGLFILVPQAP